MVPETKAIVTEVLRKISETIRPYVTRDFCAAVSRRMMELDGLVYEALRRRDYDAAYSFLVELLNFSVVREVACGAREAEAWPAYRRAELQRSGYL